MKNYKIEQGVDELNFIITEIVEILDINEITINVAGETGQHTLESCNLNINRIQEQIVSLQEEAEKWNYFKQLILNF